jgi:hypothetical protein
LTSWTRFVKWFFYFDLLNLSYLFKMSFLIWLIIQMVYFVSVKFTCCCCCCCLIPIFLAKSDCSNFSLLKSKTWSLF